MTLTHLGAVLLFRNQGQPADKGHSYNKREVPTREQQGQGCSTRQDEPGAYIQEYLRTQMQFYTVSTDQEEDSADDKF